VRDDKVKPMMATNVITNMILSHPLLVTCGENQLEIPDASSVGGCNNIKTTDEKAKIVCKT
jgi:hypothetical protein